MIKIYVIENDMVAHTVENATWEEVNDIKQLALDLHPERTMPKMLAFLKSKNIEATDKIQGVVYAHSCDKCGKLYGVPDLGWYWESDQYTCRDIILANDKDYDTTTWNSLETDDSVYNFCEDCWSLFSDEELLEGKQ